MEDLEAQLDAWEGGAWVGGVRPGVAPGAVPNAVVYDTLALQVRVVCDVCFLKTTVPLCLWSNMNVSLCMLADVHVVVWV